MPLLLLGLKCLADWPQMRGNRHDNFERQETFMSWVTPLYMTVQEFDIYVLYFPSIAWFGMRVDRS